MTATGAVAEQRDCPYFGLDYYDERWAAWFFGRETETDRIITNLRASRLTLVHADSGVGKSSLLRAGVAARLQEMAVEMRSKGRRAKYVPVVFSTWKDDPLPRLIEAIGEAIEPFLEEGGRPVLPRDSLAGAIATATQAVNGTLLVILDQFEEYFLYSAKESTPQRLADELAQCVNNVDLAANFVIAIREDAYAGLGDMFKGRIANIYGNYLDIAYLTMDEADEAIRKPVVDVYNRQPGVEPVEIEEALVAAVLDQVRTQNGSAEDLPGAAGNGHGVAHVATPLLQLVMETLWEREQADGSHVLRLKTLEELEGVEHIVDSHLAEALASLGQSGREVAIDVFAHLVTPSGGKIAESIPDLAARTGHSEVDLGDVLEELDQARILRPVAPPPGRSRRFRRYEIFHDVLAAAINRLIETRQAERSEQERQAAERQAEIERMRARRFRAVALVACSVLVLAIVAIVLALVAWHSATQDRNAANSRRLAASAQSAVTQDPELATLLALQALRTSQTQEAATALRQALPQLQLTATLDPAAPLRTVAFTTDGSRIMTAGADGTIRIADAAGLSHPRTFATAAGLTDAALSPNGSRVAATYLDGSVRILDAKTGRELQVISAHNGVGLASISFSPDGSRVATAGGDADARVWDVKTGRQLLAVSDRSPGSHVLLSVRFSPDGRRIMAASSDGKALVWSIASRQLITSMHNGTLGLLDAEFSNDGRRIVTASGPGVATIWDVASGRAVRQLFLPVKAMGARPYMWSASFSPDGTQLVTGSSDGIVRIWSVASGKVIRTCNAVQQGAAVYATYSPDGAQIAVAAAGGGVVLWNAGTGARVAERSGSGGTTPLTAAVFSPDGHLAALSNRFGTLSIWRRGRVEGSGIRSRWSQLTAIAAPEDDAVTSAAFSPDGAMLATAASSGRVWLWAMPSGTPVGELNASSLALESVAFDPANSNRLVTASDDGCAYVYNLNVTYDRLVGRRMCQGNYHLTDAVFSPDGRQILTGTSNGVVQTYSGRTHAPIGKSFLNSNSPVSGLGFSPNGRQIVVSSGSYADIYNAGVRHGFIGSVGSAKLDMQDAVFSPDGRAVVTAGSDGVARIWGVASAGDNNPSPLLVLAGHDAAIKTAVYNRSGTSVITASSDGTAMIWDTAPIEQRWLLPAARDLYLVTASFDPVDKHLVVSAGETSNRSVTGVWNLQHPAHPVASFETANGNGYAAAEFSSDGRYLVSTGGQETAAIYSVAEILRNGSQTQPLGVLNANGRDGRCASRHVNGAFTPGFDSVEFSSDDTRVATADDDGSACVWSRTTLQPLQMLVEPSGASGGVSNSSVGSAPIRWAQFDRSGRLLLTASNDGTARVWSLIGKNPPTVLEDVSGDPINDAFFSPDGTRVVTSSDAGVADVWAVGTGKILHPFVVPNRASVSNATFSPNGRQLVACGLGVSIFDVAQPARVVELSAGGGVSDCEFSPDGRYVVAAGQGGQIQIFSTELAGSLSSLEAIARQRVARQLTAAERKQYGVP